MVELPYGNKYTYHHSKGYNSKTIEIQNFWPVLFERGQNSAQDECIFMQFNSNSSPGAPIEVRNLKKLFMMKVSKIKTNKRLIVVSK